MSTELGISQKGAGASAKGGNTVARIGPCSLAPVLQVLTYDPGENPTTTAGYGAVVESTKRSLSVAKVRSLIVATDNTENGTFGSVTETPSGPGPNPTIGPVDNAAGPYDNYLLAIRVKTGGVAGLARVEVALDGSSYAYAHDIPAEAPGAIIGTTVDLKGIDTTTLNGLTVLAHNETDVTNHTTTFVSPANPAAVVSQLNAVFVANGTHMVASLVAGRYLKIASAIGGSSSSLTIASGTALAALGLVAGTYTGSPSTVILAGTNIKVTFPATSAYVAGTVYTATCTGPTVALQDVLDALDVLKANYLVSPFAKIEITQPCADGHDLRTWMDAIDAKLLSWQSGDFKAWPRAAIAGPLGATGPAGIAANDIDVRNAMNGQKGLNADAVHGDCYMVGQDIVGNFRRSAVESFTMIYAGHSLSEDPGNATFGAIPQLSLTSPDFDASTGAGVKARDENDATTKMGTSTGPGFCVLKTKPEGVFFVRGVSRAGSDSLFVDVGVIHMAYYFAAIIDQLLRTVENTTFDLTPEGYMQEAERQALSGNWTATSHAFLVDEQHASAVQVQIEHTVMVKGPNARTVIADFDAQIRGQAEHIKGKLSIDGTLSLTG